VDSLAQDSKKRYSNHLPSAKKEITIMIVRVEQVEPVDKAAAAAETSTQTLIQETVAIRVATEVDILPLVTKNE
jgi:hypothetical protein